MFVFFTLLGETKWRGIIQCFWHLLFPSVQLNLPWKVLLMLPGTFFFYICAHSPCGMLVKNNKTLLCFCSNSSAVLAPSLWRDLTVRCTAQPIRFPLFPHWISPRPSCLAKHSPLNVRHVVFCQEKAGGGAAGLGRPQFGISLLFVIHAEKWKQM